MTQQILIASDFYAPFIGGAERQVQLLAKELVLQGHSVHIATVWHEGLALEEDDDGVQIHRLKALTTLVPWFSKNPGRRYHPPFPDPALAWALRRLIKRIKPDVIHSNGWITYSCAGALVGLSVPLVVSARDYGYSCATRTLLYEGRICSGAELPKCMRCAAKSYGVPKAAVAVGGIFGSRALLKRKVSAVHSVSSFVQTIIKRDLISNQRSPVLLERIPDIVLPSGSETLSTQIDPAELPEALPKEPFMLFVGALQPHKGLKHLLSAYQQLRDAPPLVLIGTVWHDTPTEFPPGVVMLGTQPHAVVMECWRRSLFGLVPSVWPDPLPGVVREAMSQGKAVIATRVGGNTDMVEDGVNGLLVKPGDVDDLARAMQRLINDPALAAQLGRTAQEGINRFTGVAIRSTFEHLYQEVARC